MALDGVGSRGAIRHVGSMGVWQGVAMDSLKFHLGLPCPTFLHPAGRLSLKLLTIVLWVVCPQGGQLAVNFYSFRHATPYAYGLILNTG
jgi:hypothetical protein